MPDEIPFCSEGLVWKAVRAAISAPTVMSPFEFNDRILGDAAIAANNPVLYALAESARLFDGQMPSVLVSLGTGGRAARPSPPRALLGWSITILASATETEHHHKIAEKVRGGSLYSSTPPPPPLPPTAPPPLTRTYNPVLSHTPIQLLPAGAYLRLNPEGLGDCYIWEHNMDVVNDYRVRFMTPFLARMKAEVARMCALL
jgi:hypothetical protein